MIMEWILVSEASPPNEVRKEDLENTPYLTYPHYVILRFYDRHFWKYRSDWDRDVKHFPTHWMPLPLPPTNH